VVITLLAAVSAMIAAVASLVNLIATTVLIDRRLRLQWLRDELTTEIASFLDDSWRATDDARRRQRDGRLPGPARPVRHDDRPPAGRREPGDAAGIDSMRQHLTRLRLLGSARLVAACSALVGLHQDLRRTATGEQAPVLASISAARRAVIAAGKADIGA
jgi:hypothetical protein